MTISTTLLSTRELHWATAHAIGYSWSRGPQVYRALAERLLSALNAYDVLRDHYEPPVSASAAKSLESAWDKVIVAEVALLKATGN